MSRRHVRHTTRVLVVLLLAALLGGVTGTAQAPRAERRLAAPADTTPKTVAVLYFDNATGSADYDAIGRGIAAMLITDLSAVPQLRLVERDRLQAVLTEQQMQRSPLFDPATAVRAGKLLGAQYLLTGSVSAVQPTMRIDTRVVSVESGEIVQTARVQGPQDRFFDLQQRLAHDLVKALPVAVSPEALTRLREAQERDRIAEATTVVDFSQGLARYDQGDYVGAVEKLGRVMLRSPDALVVRLSYEEAKRRSASTVKQKVRDRLQGLLRRP